MYGDSHTTLSVIIPAYGQTADLRVCLESVRQMQPAPDEVIVVADGHQDPVEQVAREIGATYLAAENRGGPARARNLGARAARGHVLLFLDADVSAPRDLVARVGALFRSHPEMAAAFGSYDAQPAAQNLLSQYRNLLHHYVHQHGNREAATFWAGCGAIRREVFLAAGGFSKHYRRPAVEDIELGGRLRKMGHQVLLDRSLQVQHLKSWRLLSMLRADLFHRAIPWARLLVRQRHLPNDLNLRTADRISALLVLALGLALVFSLRWPLLLATLPPAAAFFLFLNRDLYAFFRRQRGIGFMLRAIPCHALYYLCGGCGLFLGTLLELVHGAPAESPRLTTQGVRSA